MSVDAATEKTETGRTGDLRGFLRGAVLFLVVGLALDQSAGAALRRLYFRQTSGLQYRTTYSLERTTAGTLVFGTSRANHHYVPSVFRAGLGAEYYNVGRDGSSILYHGAVLASVLRRYTPQTVILDLTPNEFASSRVPYERLSVLLPYFDGHPELRPILLLRSRFERLKLLSRVYPFNSSLLTIVIGNMEMNKARKSDEMGYIPLYREWTGALGDAEDPGGEIDPALVREFSRFVDLATARSIRLYVVASPAFQKFPSEPESFRIARGICEKGGVPFWDFTNDAYYLGRPGLFQDTYHLNDKGAADFSERVVRRIRG